MSFLLVLSLCELCHNNVLSLSFCVCTGYSRVYAVSSSFSRGDVRILFFPKYWVGEKKNFYMEAKKKLSIYHYILLLYDRQRIWWRCGKIVYTESIPDTESSTHTESSSRVATIYTERVVLLYKKVLRQDYLWYLFCIFLSTYTGIFCWFIIVPLADTTQYMGYKNVWYAAVLVFIWSQHRESRGFPGLFLV